MKTLVLLMMSLSMAGCAGNGVTYGINATPTVNIATDSYCKIYSKITWSPHDTPDTVRQVLRENGKFDRACAAKGGPTS